MSKRKPLNFIIFHLCSKFNRKFALPQNVRLGYSYEIVSIGPMCIVFEYWSTKYTASSFRLECTIAKKNETVVAFDTVYLDILLCKFWKYGFHDKASVWLRNYTFNIEQFVRLLGCDFPQSTITMWRAPGFHSWATIIHYLYKGLKCPTTLVLAIN